MGKKKPCKPKPKLSNVYINALYEWVLANPRPVILCPIHVK